MPTLLAALLFSVLHAANPAPAEPSLPPGTIAVVLDLRITEAERGELNAIVLPILLRRFAHDNNLAPSKAELDAAERHATGGTEEELDRLISQRESLKARIRLLADASDPALDAARQELEGLETRIQNLLGAFGGNPFYDPGPSLQRIARIKAARWKTSHALFVRYGGRVAITPSGPEPIDAYRQFLKDQEAAGAFRFADDATRDSFWAEWNDDDDRRWLPADQAKSYFDTPWWLAEEPE